MQGGPTQAVFLLDVRSLGQYGEKVYNTVTHVLVTHASKSGMLETDKLRWGYLLYDSQGEVELPTDSGGFRNFSQKELDSLKAKVEAYSWVAPGDGGAAANLARVLKETCACFNWQQVMIFSPVKASPGMSRGNRDEDDVSEKIIYIMQPVPKTENKVQAFTSGGSTAKDVAQAIVPDILRKELLTTRRIKLGLIDVSEPISPYLYPFHEALQIVGGSIIPIHAEEEYCLPFSTVLNMKFGPDPNEHIAKYVENCLAKNENILGITGCLNTMVATWSQAWLVGYPYAQALAKQLYLRNQSLLVQIDDRVGVVCPLGPSGAVVKISPDSTLTERIKAILKKQGGKKVPMRPRAPVPPHMQFKPYMLENWYTPRRCNSELASQLKKLMDDKIAADPLYKMLRNMYKRELASPEESHASSLPLHVWQRHTSDSSSQSSGHQRDTSLTTKRSSRADKILNKSREVSLQNKEAQLVMKEQENLAKVESKERKSREKRKLADRMREEVLRRVGDTSNRDHINSVVQEVCEEAAEKKDVNLVTCAQTVVNLVMKHLQEVKATPFETCARAMLHEALILSPQELSSKYRGKPLETRVRHYKLQILFRMEVSWVLPDEDMDDILKRGILDYLRMISVHMDPESTCTFMQDDLVDNYMYTQQDLLVELYEEMNCPLPSALLEVVSPSKLSDSNPSSVQSLHSVKSQLSSLGSNRVGGAGGRELRSSKFGGRSSSFMENQLKRQIAVPVRKVVKEEAKSHARVAKDGGVPVARRVRRNLFDADNSMGSTSRVSRSPRKSPRKLGMAQVTPKKSPGRMKKKEEASPGRVLRRHQSFYPPTANVPKHRSLERSASLKTAEATATQPESQSSNIRFFFSQVLSQMSQSSNNTFPTPTKSILTPSKSAATPSKSILTPSKSAGKPGSAVKGFGPDLSTPVKRVQFNLDHPSPSFRMSSPRGILKASPRVTRVSPERLAHEVSLVSPQKSTPVRVSLFQQEGQLMIGNSVCGILDNTVPTASTSGHSVESIVTDQDEQLSPDTPVSPSRVTETDCEYVSRDTEISISDDSSLNCNNAASQALADTAQCQVESSTWDDTSSLKQDITRSSTEASSASTSSAFNTSSSGDASHWEVVTNVAPLVISLKRTESPQPSPSSNVFVSEPTTSTPLVSGTAPVKHQMRFTRRISKETGLSLDLYNKLVSPSPLKQGAAGNDNSGQNAAPSKGRKRKWSGKSWESVSPALPESAHTSCVEAGPRDQATPSKRKFKINRTFTPPSTLAIHHLTTSPILNSAAKKAKKQA